MSYVGVGLGSTSPLSGKSSDLTELAGSLETILKSELLRRIVKIKFKKEIKQHAETSKFKVMGIFFPNQPTALRVDSTAV